MPLTTLAKTQHSDLTGILRHKQFKMHSLIFLILVFQTLLLLPVMTAAENPHAAHPTGTRPRNGGPKTNLRKRMVLQTDNIQGDSLVLEDVFINENGEDIAIDMDEWEMDFYNDDNDQELNDSDTDTQNVEEAFSKRKQRRLSKRFELSDLTERIPKKYSVYGIWEATCTVNATTNATVNSYTRPRTSALLNTNSCNGTNFNSTWESVFDGKVMLVESIFLGCLNPALTTCPLGVTNLAVAEADVSSWPGCVSESSDWKLNVGYGIACINSKPFLQTFMWVHGGVSLNPKFCWPSNETFFPVGGSNNATSNATITFYLTCRPDIVNNALISGAGGMAASVGVLFIFGLITKYLAERKRNMCVACFTGFGRCCLPHRSKA